MRVHKKNPLIFRMGVERLRWIAKRWHPHRPGFPAGFSTFPANVAGGLLGLRRAGPSAPLDEVKRIHLLEATIEFEALAVKQANAPRFER